MVSPSAAHSAFAGHYFGSLALHQNSMRVLVGERDERATRSAANAISEQLDIASIAVRNLRFARRMALLLLPF
jgi:hypothetical protein